MRLAHGTTEFLLVLVPGFSQLCLSSFIDPLRYANRLSGWERFRWKLISEDGAPVECSSGIRVCVDASLDKEANFLKSSNLPYGIALFAGVGVEHYQSAPLISLLRFYARHNITLYGFGTGAWILAAAGLLLDARCTIHWDMMAAFSESFDDLELADALFVEQRKIVTCAGEFAAFDLAISIVEKCCGLDLAQSVCRFVIANRRRDGESRQSVPHGLRFGCGSEKLICVIRVMENSLENPLSLSAISLLEGISCRQIQRLFLHHLQAKPMRYYLLLRLIRARQLIESTNMTMLEVAIACGFISSSHFTKCFRDHFGEVPSSLRPG